MAEFAPDVGDGEAGVAPRCDRETDSGHVVRKYAVEHAARLETAGVLQELELQPESRRDLDDRGTTHSCGNALRRCPNVVVRDHATIMGRANGMSETRQPAGGSSSRLKRVTTTTKTFTARAIPADVVAELRARDDSGNAPEPILDRDGGSPLRCCLRMTLPAARNAEAVACQVTRDGKPLHDAKELAKALDWTPMITSGFTFYPRAYPLRAVMPGWPEDYRGLPRVLRAYGANGRIRGGVVVPEGAVNPKELVDQVFADPEVAFIHARALIFGCFTFAIERA